MYTHNANSFSNAVAEVLVGKGIPEEYLKIPEEFLETEFGKKLVPKLEIMNENLKKCSWPLFNANGSMIEVR